MQQVSGTFIFSLSRRRRGGVRAISTPSRSPSTLSDGQVRLKLTAGLMFFSLSLVGGKTSASCPLAEVQTVTVTLSDVNPQPTDLSSSLSAPSPSISASASVEGGEQSIPTVEASSSEEGVPVPTPSEVQPPTPTPSSVDADPQRSNCTFFSPLSETGRVVKDSFLWRVQF